MIWHPIEPAPGSANKGEAKVWGKLKQGLDSEEGLGFIRYPIFGAWGSRRSEPDILLILRNYGIFIFESKGCYISNIDSICGQMWNMSSDWYKPVMKPWEQVENQVKAVEVLVEQLPFRFPVHGRVIVPFISEEEWIKANLIQPGHDPIWTFDHLTEKRLLSNLEGIKNLGPVLNLSDLEWEQLKGQFERQNQTLTLNNAVKQPILIHYNGDVPSNKAVNDMIISAGMPNDWQQRGFTYLVATAKLDSKRSKAFRPEHQINNNDRANTRQFIELEKLEKDDEGNVIYPAHLIFHKALRHLVPDRIISRTSERTLLSRAFNEFAKNNSDKLQQLTHDLFEWSDAIAIVESEGMNVDADIPLDFTTPSLSKLTKDIQAAFEKQLVAEQNAGINFERAVRRYLDNGFRPTPYIVVEGFSFLTPLQKYLIQKCRSAGAQILIICPFREEQTYGFSAITRTYEHLKLKPLKFSNDFINLDNKQDLLQLKTRLFSNSNPDYNFAGDGSVNFRTFRHQNNEVSYCINQIISLLLSTDSIGPKENGRYTINPTGAVGDIIVVTQNPDSLVPLLLEEAELIGLPSTIFNTPPRQLLLTPLGQFILVLYKIWANDALDLADDQFEALLASGLWSSAQSTTDRFRSVRVQWFAKCKTENEWTNRLGELESLTKLRLEDDNRLPSSLIDRTHTQIWSKLLKTVIGLCKLLFDGNKVSIREHVDKLLKGLATSYNREELLGTELELLVKIEEALGQLTQSEGLSIHTQEFGDILNSLVKERKQVGNAPAEIDSKKINVVMPQGLDNSSQKIIFYLAINNKSVPRGLSPSWPIYNYALDDHYEQERYLFLAVVRATTQILFLSYSATDGESIFRPSLYLTEAAEVIGTTVPKLPPIQSEKIGKYELTDEKAGSISETSTVLEFKFTDLYHFKLCPFRYKLEKLDRRARVQTDKFNLRFQAQGSWLRRAFLAWEKKGELSALDNSNGEIRKKQVINHLLMFVDAEKAHIVGLFPSFDANDWKGIEYRVKNAVNQLCRFNIPQLESGGINCKVESKVVSIPIQGTDDLITVKEHEVICLFNAYKEIIISNVQVFEEWSIPRSTDPEQLQPEILIKQGIEIANHDKACFSKWQFNFQKLNRLPNDVLSELTSTIADISKNSFPKNPGHHCKYCPARGTCLGVE